jgi:hypothetical protein
MSSPIDPTRRAARLRRAARAQAAHAPADRAEEVHETGGAGLPVPVDAPRTVPRGEPPASAAIFDAQLLGQDGEKRGLRAGPHAIDRAKASYNRVEWSDAKDRRARNGRYKTEI